MRQVQINGICVEYRFDGHEGGPVILLPNSLASTNAMLGCTGSRAHASRVSGVAL
ncbi:MAG: hypothetical protein ACI9DC_000657 [Gammaproteobacteria bacterium]|jgi:hypothetical protein